MAAFALSLAIQLFRVIKQPHFGVVPLAIPSRGLAATTELTVVVVIPFLSFKIVRKTQLFFTFVIVTDEVTSWFSVGVKDVTEWLPRR
jgi:hypothetical protein